MSNEEDKAFKEFLTALNMSFVADEDGDYIVTKDEMRDEMIVYKKEEDGFYHKFDDRGKLFVSLRNVANCIYPNLLFRSEDYIL